MDYVVEVYNPVTGETDDFSFTGSLDKSPNQEAQEYVDKDYPGCTWKFIEY